MTNDSSADAQAGSKTLRTKHDPVQMGWHVGDRIAIAKTTGNDRGQHVEITGISSFKIDIKDRTTVCKISTNQDYIFPFRFIQFA